MSNYFLSSTSCLPASSCPIGTLPLNNQCQSCTGCATCQGTLANCTGCALGTFLYQNQCLLSCVAGLYGQSGANVCANCPDGCATCTGNSLSLCLSCQQSSLGVKYYYKTGQGCLTQAQCETNQTYYAYATTFSCQSCQLPCRNENRVVHPRAESSRQASEPFFSLLSRAEF